MSKLPEIILATRNEAKAAEIAEILKGEAVIRPLTPADGVVLPPEDGVTYEENARIKAAAVMRALGAPALADDSGLEVEALGGLPGVHSSRYAGGGGDAANNAKLIEALRTTPPAARGARFVCVAALVLPDGGVFKARGDVAGRILNEPRGRGGFGYDPLFVPEGYDRTFGEMTPRQKNALSHRARAFAAMGSIISRLRRDGRLPAAGG